ncbi:hypothetical protein Tco_1271262, partial [Tanacetum coccineum]
MMRFVDRCSGVDIYTVLERIEKTKRSKNSQKPTKNERDKTRAKKQPKIKAGSADIARKAVKVFWKEILTGVILYIYKFDYTNDQKVREESESTIPDPDQTVTSTPPVIAPFTNVTSSMPSLLVTPPPINTEATTITNTRDAGADSSMHRSDPESEQSSDDIPMQDEGNISDMEDTDN